MQIERREVLDKIQPNWKVLDIGSWIDVFPRADWVIDIGSYETRTNNHPNEKEYFTNDTWIVGDICQEKVWNQFSDKEFDFAICSHLLEDIRDPLSVCKQLNRVAKAGYIECPSRFRECARAKSSDTVSGYDHHRWILDIVDGELVFTPKLHWANHIDYLGDHRRHFLNAYQFHFTGVFWEESFNYYERTHKGTLMESCNLLHFYDKYDYQNTQFVFDIKAGVQIHETGSVIWNDKYRSPIEEEGEDVINHYKELYYRRLSDLDLKS